MLFQMGVHLWQLRQSVKKFSLTLGEVKMQNSVGSHLNEVRVNAKIHLYLLLFAF